MKYLNHLTELVVLLCLSKTLYDPTHVTAALLLIAMLAYMHKMYEENKKKIIEENIQHLNEKLSKEILSVSTENQVHRDVFSSFRTECRDEFAEIDRALLEFGKTQAKVEKSAEDIKKVISTTNLGNALYTRVRRKDA